MISVVRGVREIKGIDSVIDVVTNEEVNIHSLKLGHVYNILLKTSPQIKDMQDLNVNDESGLLTITDNGYFQVTGVGTGKITVTSPNDGGKLDINYTSVFNDAVLGEIITASLENHTGNITKRDLKNIEVLKDKVGNTIFSWQNIKSLEDLGFLPNLAILTIKDANFNSLRLNLERLEELDVYNSSIKEISLENLPLLSKLQLELTSSLNKLALIGLTDLDEFEIDFINSQDRIIKEVYIESCPELYNLYMYAYKVEKATIKDSNKLREVIFGTISDITLEGLVGLTHLSVKTNKLNKLSFINLPYFTFDDDSINLEV